MVLTLPWGKDNLKRNGATVPLSLLATVPFPARHAISARVARLLSLLLYNHSMVLVGGGRNTNETYLRAIDPCRGIEE